MLLNLNWYNKMANKTNKYYCEGCKKIVNRESSEKTIKSWCATLDKDVLIKMVEPKQDNEKNKLMKLARKHLNKKENILFLQSSDCVDEDAVNCIAHMMVEFHLNMIKK